MNGGEINIICGVRYPWSSSRSAFLQNQDSILLYDSRYTFFQYPFHIEEGCLWISKSQFNIFLFQFDRMQNSKITETISCFLGLSPEITKIPTLNETSPERLQLKTLVKSFQIPESVSAYFASSKLSRHFFSAEEIARFISNK